MFTRIGIYCFLYPLSLLPMPILYGIGAGVRFFLCNLFRYRKEVVRENLKKSFPQKTADELAEIERKYYIHLCNIFMEGVKLLTISKKSLMRRYRCVNAEIVNACFEEGKSVILMSSHYNNWEWLVLSLSLHFSHHGVGVGKANSNKVFEKIINRARMRYGTEVVFADNVRNLIENYDKKGKLSAYMMLSDQNPPNVEKSYKTVFLNQPSAMIYGSEYFAKKYDFPVFYYVVKQTKRGYYAIEIEKLTDRPTQQPYGEIIEQYVRCLERDICEKPQFWLWSHRRWKYRIGENELTCKKQV
ncbi:MAG: lysophospholipid acyltransferase family protein [Lentimicrobiaceae bacterium]|nr:lysophospholipid acyltransferase family protein [Lentimicrobiaceae bacterium]